MAGNSLQEFRGQVTIAYLSDVIDMEDYVYLYSTNQSRENFPYCKFDKFDFENWDDTECYKELRFRKDDIADLLEIHACSNPSPLTKSMQLYFRNYMKYSNRSLS